MGDWVKHTLPPLVARRHRTVAQVRPCYQHSERHSSRLHTSRRTLEPLLAQVSMRNRAPAPIGSLTLTLERRHRAPLASHPHIPASSGKTPRHTERDRERDREIKPRRQRISASRTQNGVVESSRVL